MGLRIGIVGAGFAGVSTAKVLASVGYDVHVFEKEPDVGGVWAASRRYPGLTTQNPRSTYALSDFPMPDDYPEWPSGEQVQQYFEAYIDHFDIRRLISFNTRIESARWNSEKAKWVVETQVGKAASAGREEFDYLIVCNGIFSLPSVPHYDNADAWKAAGGKILHTSEFTRLDDAKDKHVLVIGYGKSSCDVAMATLGNSASTTLIARNLVWKIPKKIAGVLNFKHLFLTRLGEGLFPYIELRGFERFLHGWGRPLRELALGTVQAIISAQLKLKKIGLHPGKPLETIARSTVSLVTPGFYEAVKEGTLGVEKNAEVTRLEPGKAVLSNGKELPADLIVAGTGWQQKVPFLSPDVMSRITNADGDFLLYKSMLPMGVPNLLFNGYNSSFFSQLNCEVGAMWIAEYLRGGVAIPAREIRQADVERRLAWMRERTDGKHCHGTNIVPFSVHHIDELLNDIDLNIGVSARFKQWFVALDPSDYAQNHAKLASRAGAGRNMAPGATASPRSEYAVS